MEPGRIDKSSINSSKISENISWLERERLRRAGQTVETELSLSPMNMCESIKGFIRDQGKSLSKGKLLLITTNDKVEERAQDGPVQDLSNGRREKGMDGEGQDQCGHDRSDFDRDTEDLIAHIRSGRSIDGKLVEMDLKGKGGPRYLMISCLPLPENEGSPSELLILSMDVTELKVGLDMSFKSLKENGFALERSKKELEAAAVRSEQWKDLNELLGSLVGAGSFIMDTATGRITGSDVFNSMVGIDKGDRSDMGSFLEGVHEEDRNKVRSFLLGKKDKRSSHQMDLRSLHSGKGTEKVISLRTVPPGPKGNAGTVLGVIIDLTLAGNKVDPTRQGQGYECPDEASIFDRERRMIELKDEVNGLMKELGRPEKYPSYRV